MGFYNLHRLSAGGYATVRERLDEAMRAHARPDGTIPCTLPIRHIRAYKP